MVNSETTLTLSPNSIRNLDHIQESKRHSPIISPERRADNQPVYHNGITRKKPILRSLFTIFDFIHFLIFGKSYHQKQREIQIFKKWEFQFRLDSTETLFDHQFRGRCFCGANNADNNVLNYLMDPVIVEARSSNVNDKSLANGQIMLAKFERIPFPKTDKKDNDIPRCNFISFVQISKKSDWECNANDFIIPQNLWREYNFQIGDRASCTVIEYRRNAVDKLILKLNAQVSLMNCGITLVSCPST